MEVEGLLSLAVFIAAFALASLAAQSWRELGILAVLATPFYWALKWLAAGTSFAADTLTWGGEPYKISFSPGDGFMAAIGLAAIAMILWRHFRIKREEEPRPDPY
jgi:hypothetical protein